MFVCLHPFFFVWRIFCPFLPYCLFLVLLLLGMYNVPVRPSKIANKSRRGMNSSIDRLDSCKELQKGQKSLQDKNDACDSIQSLPRPVFHNNHKKSPNSKQPEPISSEYEEALDFLSEYWNGVWKEYEEQVENNSTGPDTVIYYEEKSPNKMLEDFKPFDLEAWWGKRLFNNLTKTIP